MQREARQKQYRKIKQGQKMLNFGASKPGVRERATNPPPPPHQDPLVAYVGLMWCVMWCVKILPFYLLTIGTARYNQAKHSATEFIFPTPTLAKQQCLKDGRCKRQMFSWLTYNWRVLFHVATYFVALLTLHLQTLNDTIFVNLRR